MRNIKKNWDDQTATRLVDEFLNPFDDGELFVEEVFSENIVFDDNKIKNSSFDQDRGFGIRALYGETTKFFHSTNLESETLKKVLSP